MFSLIITIVSIALVVALAAGTMYYLNSSGTNPEASVAASTLINQSGQIAAAIELHRIEKGVAIEALDSLVENKYLTALPLPTQASFVTTVTPSTADWSLEDAATSPKVYLRNKINQETCLQVNAKFLGTPGIPGVESSAKVSCFGNQAPYTLVIHADKTTQTASGGGEVAKDPIEVYIDDLSGGSLLANMAFDFGEVTTFSTPESKRLIVKNTAEDVLTFSSEPAVTGASAFNLEVSDCYGVLGPGEVCKAQVSFSPSAAGSYAGQLELYSADFSSPQQVKLTAAVLNPLTLANTTIPAANGGIAYSFDLKNLLKFNGESIPSSEVYWAITDTLPAGLTFTSTTGILSGRPTELLETKQVTIRAEYSGNFVERQYDIHVKPLEATASWEFDNAASGSVTPSDIGVGSLVTGNIAYTSDGYSGNAAQFTGAYFTAVNPAWSSLGTADFCIEWWQKGSSAWAEFIFGQPQTYAPLTLSSYGLYSAINGQNDYSTAIPYVPSPESTTSWQHMAIVRENGYLKVFVNGSFRTGAAMNFDPGLVYNSQLVFGYYLTPFTGKIDKVKVHIGTAPYKGTQSFVPN